MRLTGGVTLPITATSSVPPTSRVALFIPEPIPAFSRGTASQPFPPRRPPVSLAMVRSIFHLYLPSRSFPSIPRRAMRGTMPYARSHRRWTS